MTTRSELPIAGVPWPVYKLIALAVSALVFVLVGAVTLSAGPAVLAAAGTGTVVWLVLGRAARSQHRQPSSSMR